MAAYTPLGPQGYTPQLEPPYRPSSDLTSTELRQLNSDPSYNRSRASSLQQPHPYDIYSYSGDGEAKPFVNGSIVNDLMVYQRYKRRCFGLAQITLLNFAIGKPLVVLLPLQEIMTFFRGWGYAARGVVSTTATEWFNISYATPNNLSIASSLVFLVPAPFVIWVLNKHGPKVSIIVACVLTVVGNWIIYAATSQHSFAGYVVGVVIYSLAAPFIQAVSTMLA